MSVKFWWERAYQLEGRQGRIARTKDTSETIACPKCGNAPVVYNGNYFCDNWNYPAGSDDCDWALGSPARKVKDRAICDLIGLDYRGGLAEHEHVWADGVGNELDRCARCDMDEGPDE